MGPLKRRRRRRNHYTHIRLQRHMGQGRTRREEKVKYVSGHMECQQCESIEWMSPFVPSLCNAHFLSRVVVCAVYSRGEGGPGSLGVFISGCHVMLEQIWHLASFFFSFPLTSLWLPHFISGSNREGVVCILTSFFLWLETLYFSRISVSYDVIWKRAQKSTWNSSMKGFSLISQLYKKEVSLRTWLNRPPQFPKVQFC